MSNNNKKGNIHSIFKKGFNVQFDEQLVYISSDQQPLSTHGIQWSEEVFELVLPHLKEGFFVQVASDYWRFFTRPVMDIHITDTIEKYLHLNQYEWNETRSQSLIELLIAESISLHCDPYLFAIDPRIKELNSLHQNWRQMKWMSQWIGAGKGLTPSGDDFLQGMLIGSWLQKDASFRFNVQEALQKRSTTDVATAYYLDALSGEANELWHQLIQSMITSNALKNQQTIQHIKNYGATSGSDMLYGILFYFSQITL